ncbi:uncharacterized protein LOC111133673 isoform X1 [Crassostrea virginica]
MRIGDVVVSGVPDLYFWTRIPENSVATVAVTEIIFTYLEISPDHVALIQECGGVECKLKLNKRPSGRIYYTRPYDYLKEEDRNEILEFMFWLGLHSLPSGYRPKVKSKMNA